MVCAASAGIIGGLGHGVAIAHAPLASSYQNNNQISLHPTAVVAHAVAPVAVAHAPVAVGIGLHGLGGLGGLGLH